MTTLNDILQHAYDTKEEGTGRQGKNNCSGFVRMVAARLQIKLEGQQADDQLEYMQRHWIRLKDGTHALQMASQRFFVVGGLKSTEYDPPRSNGHVAVVQPLTSTQLPVGPEDMYRGKYPYVWGGDIGGEYMTRGDRSMGEIINRKVRDNVRYYMPPVFGPHTPEFR
ncbi:MAG TPA: hypothetical protein VM759_12375 [Longimicrobium sp.]|nr:hypothetical protein [Longimicrobium sp.]